MPFHHPPFLWILHAALPVLSLAHWTLVSHSASSLLPFRLSSFPSFAFRFPSLAPLTALFCLDHSTPQVASVTKRQEVIVESLTLRLQAGEDVETELS